MTTPSSVDVFKALVAQTELEQHVASGDSWLVITKKILKKKKIDCPTVSLTSFNSTLLAHPSFYLLLISEEKLVAVQNIQSFVRSQFGAVLPHLVEEVCQLVLTLSNLLLLTSPRVTTNEVAAGGGSAPTAGPAVTTPALLYEALEPLISVLDGKLLYLKGRKEGLPSSDIARVQHALAATGEADKKSAQGDRTTTKKGPLAT